ncbi:glutamate racemase [Deminuibacter soli]|uniref:Glutamate racemase n=1 Tax=Deminuibacter soli TaxID=2291815 RepID=A0A3E1NRD1_9BACT|nr:glutamate racemase [Deminuibacter soli]RFM30485.1 glutamate racemase [Deminuibacter soli]
MQQIGVFDSGYGGLAVLKEIVARLPQYDYLYLGDNARAPYGNRSFETVYQYTLQCVRWFFDQGCPLVILACNTASAKALRTIQQADLPQIAPGNRVLGIIRPTAEVIGQYTQSKHVGVLATRGTVLSGSYEIEISKAFPGVAVTQLACPMWVPLVENNEHESAGADYFVQQKIEEVLQKDPAIDALLLACTHYPLLLPKIRQFVPAGVQVIAQGEIVAASLENYLKRHPEMEVKLNRQGRRSFYTTDDAADFATHASIFFGAAVTAQHVTLP